MVRQIAENDACISGLVFPHAFNSKENFIKGEVSTDDGHIKRS